MTKYVWLGGAIFVGLIMVGFAVINSGRSNKTEFSYVGSTIKPPSDSRRALDTSAESATGASPQFVKADAKPDPLPAAAGVAVIPEDRKIAFTAVLEVVVPELQPAVLKVDQAVTTHKGYIAKSEVKADATTRRLATFTIRVPVGDFRKLMSELKALGVADKDQVDSEDKTEEVVDVEARIKNLKTEEEVLNKLLKEAANRIEEVLRLREHIKANRGEIERSQARLDALTRLTAQSTITLTLKEEAKGVIAPPPSPQPEPPPPPTFEERTDQTFGESWGLFTRFSQWVALIVVGATPWLLLVVPIGLIGYVVGRRTWRTTTVK